MLIEPYNTITLTSTVLTVLALSLRNFTNIIPIRSIGSTLRILSSILYSIIPFLTILFYTIFTFGIILFAAFYSINDKFSSVEKSFVTMFDFTIGNVDFESFNGDKGGIILTIIWIILANILLMNILIAILSSKFSSVYD